MSDRKKALAIVFFLALIIPFVTMALVFPELNQDVDIDWHLSLAKSLVAGKGYVVELPIGQEKPQLTRAPAHPLFLAGLMRLGGDSLGFFLSVQCVLGSAICGLTVLLAARWLPLIWATMAGLLVAIDPNSVMRCADLRDELLFTLFVPGKISLAHMRATPVPPSPWWPPLYSLILFASFLLSIVGVAKLRRPAVSLGLLVTYFVIFGLGSSRFRTQLTPMLAALTVAGGRE